MGVRKSLKLTGTWVETVVSGVPSEEGRVVPLRTVRSGFVDSSKPMTPLDADLVGSRILVVDDEDANIRLLERILDRAGYRRVRGLTDPHEAIDDFDAFGADLVLLDLNMAPLDGFGVMSRIRARLEPGTYLPIMMLTADDSPVTRKRALASGASDFLTKPYDPVEVLLRVRNLLETRRNHLRLQDMNTALEQGVRLQMIELEEAREDIVDCLGRAAEYRDDATGEHTRRVGDLSALLAARLGLGDDQVELMRRAATLHDIGKIGIPDRILLKPGRLTPEEFEVMKTHTTIGARILSGSRSPVLKLAREVALTHHERWDGEGYAGLQGDEIPLSGRIVAVADTFDALTHRRPYKEAWSEERAIAEVDAERGRQFDPVVVDAFLAIMRQRGHAAFVERPCPS